MTTAKKRFSSRLSADSEGEEGKFYVWSLAEIMRALGNEDGEFFARHYDVTLGGNFEGHNILNRLKPIERSEPDKARLAGLRTKLLAVRGTRVRPGLDDKVLADWNGLMIAALANASLMLDEPSWLDPAARAFEFVARAMTRGDRLGHSWRQGQLKFPGLASDFAAMIRAALALFEATGKKPYLDQALVWQRGLDRDYADAATGTYYLTAADAEGLVIRPASTADEATPNHNAVAAQNLIRLAVLAGEDRFLEQADRLIAAIAPQAVENLYMHMALLNAIDLRLRAAEIVVTGEGAAAQALLATARAWPPLNRIVLHAGSAQALPAQHPARAKVAAMGEPAAFVCVGETCSLPVTDPASLTAAIDAVRHSCRGASFDSDLCSIGAAGAQQGKPNDAIRTHLGRRPGRHGHDQCLRRRRMVRLCHRRQGAHRMRLFERCPMRECRRQGRHMLCRPGIRAQDQAPRGAAAGQFFARAVTAFRIRAAPRRAQP